MYQAVVHRDPDYEGAFFVGVKTTGVFCRPTCPARPPKAENCEFFATAQEALLAAYRPCKRCRPLSPPEESSEVIRRLVSAVEQEPERRWRDSDVSAFGAHPATVRRQFQQRFGMTFIEYARARRLGDAFKAIRAGQRVIIAQMDSGYSSASAFRHAFSKLLGSAPGKRDARLLAAAWFDTPVGAMIAVSDEQRLHMLEYVDRRGLERQLERLRARTKAGVAPGKTGPIAQIEKELAEYFSGTIRPFQTPLARGGTPFQNAVWDALLRIPAGKTWTYGELASAAGQPGAARAAARANGANQFAIVIPCHRVIGAGGDLVGYGGGLHRKRWLLEHERRSSARLLPPTAISG
jgi:AraC family transcriptional regulator of adaptative response/methylated-DNA-[protein]-cysteine methyltransferase